MVYVGVEFRDNLRGRTREFWAMMPYEQTNSEEEIVEESEQTVGESEEKTQE